RKSTRVNPFVQTWAPLQKKLPKPLKKMWKIASRFHLRFDALALAKNIKEELPVWFHIGGKVDLARHNNTNCAKCLSTNHRVKTVGHISSIIQRNYARHNRRRNCACPSCKEDRRMGCDAPYKCQEEALKILDCLNDKWDPRQNTHQLNADLSKEELLVNSEAIINKDEVIFDPKITLCSVEDGYRIFCEQSGDSPANQMLPEDDEE
ncbi:hypothetical protein C8R43DRAFT_835695, partial [Mycena crocata]